MALGPIMLDVVGLALTDDDIRRLTNPLVGGVILFSRNFESCKQLLALTQAIHQLRSPRLLIAVDHEGGRVQRFRKGFTPLPPMRAIGKVWNDSPRDAKKLAELAGWVLGAELAAHGVDFSFTPVLDIDYGDSKVIGDRAFHRDIRAINDLASALMVGLRKAGMAAIGKHFPGHGYVVADSHIEMPVDERSFDQIAQNDMQPFRMLIDNEIQGIMPAHVIYPHVDDKPAGFSSRWLQKVLRERLAFNGAILSDDLSMQAATVAGDVTSRTKLALEAGCDMALLCNQPKMADELLANLEWTMSAMSLTRLARLHGKKPVPGMSMLKKDPNYQSAIAQLASIGASESDLFDPTNQPLNT